MWRGDIPLDLSGNKASGFRLFFTPRLRFLSLCTALTLTNSFNCFHDCSCYYRIELSSQCQQQQLLSVGRSARLVRSLGRVIEGVSVPLAPVGCVGGG